MAEQATQASEVRTPLTPVEAYRKRSWWQRLKQRMAGSMHPVGTLAAPMGQHLEETADQKWQRAHGFSAARAPLPWGEDITKHNVAVDQEYQEEIAARKAALLAGQYTPRFLKSSAYQDEKVLNDTAPIGTYRVLRDGHFVRDTSEHYDAFQDEYTHGPWVLYGTVTTHAVAESARGLEMAPVDRPDGLSVIYAYGLDVLKPEEVDWDLELSVSPGRRTNVTTDPGVPHQPMLTQQEYDEVKALSAMLATVRAAEIEAKTPRAIIGSRQTILDACGGDEQVADQVEASARKHFGVADLDALFPAKVDA